MNGLLVGLATVPAPVAGTDPQTVACGPKGQQSWLCTTVFRITDSRSAAELADRFAKPLRIVLVLVVAYVVVRVLRFTIKRSVRRMQSEGTHEKISALRRRTGLALLDTGSVPTVRRAQRAETIGTLLRSLASFVVWATAVLTILKELGVNLAPIIAGAGVVGLAIGFGAQTLVKDFLSGLFMLFENQFGVGDMIDAGPAVGHVEGVSLRTTRLRDVEGVVWHIPNGEIRRVGNKSQQWARAMLDVAVSYDTDIPVATEVIQRVADEMWHEPQYQQLIVGAPEVWGVEALDVDRIIIRLVVRTRPLEQGPVARELRARIKVAFDRAGIEMPLPKQTITYRTAVDAMPPPPVSSPSAAPAEPKPNDR